MLRAQWELQVNWPAHNGTMAFLLGSIARFSAGIVNFGVANDSSLNRLTLAAPEECRTRNLKFPCIFCRETRASIHFCVQHVETQEAERAFNAAPMFLVDVGKRPVHVSEKLGSYQIAKAKNRTSACVAAPRCLCGGALPGSA